MHRRTIRDVYQDAYFAALDDGLTEDAARWHAERAEQNEKEMQYEAQEFNREVADGR